MTFSERVRRELVERPPARRCCRTAFMSALLRSAGVLQVRAGGELAVRLEQIDAGHRPAAVGDAAIGRLRR